METRNTNIVSNLMEAGPRSSGKGFAPGGRDSGAPEFDPFLKNETRVARNDRTQVTSRHEAASTRRPGSSFETTHNKQTQTPSHKNEVADGTQTEHRSQAVPQTERRTGLEQALSRLAENESSPVARQKLAALLENGGLMAAQTQLAAQEPNGALSTETQPVSASDALTQLLEQIKNNPDAALMGLVQSQNGNASRETLIEQLKQMDLDPEVLDRLLDALNGGTGEEGQASAFLQALNGLLNALNNANTQAEGEGATVNASANTNAADKTSVLEQKILAALVKAGLSEDEAQKVLKNAKGSGENGKNVDARSVLTQLAKNLTKSKETGDSEAKTSPTSSESKPTTPVKEQAFSLETKKSGQDMKALSDMAAGKPDTKTVSNLTHEGRAQANAHSTQAPAAPVAPKAASAAASTQTGPAVQSVSTGGENAPALTGAQGAAQAGDKAAEGFKPLMAETYTQRGGVEKPLASQIIEKVTFRGFGNQREVHIKLDPPSLGTVRMNVSSRGDSLRATLVAENHAVKQAIESSLPQLRDTMMSQGMKVDSFTVLVGGNNAGQHAHQRPDGIHPFRPFETGSESHGPEGGEETLAFHRPLFLNESQTISLFA